MTEPRDYVIRKSGFFYRPNAQGYTASALEAGLFTLEEAIKYSHPNGLIGPRDGITYHHRSTFPQLADKPVARFECAEMVADNGSRYYEAHLDGDDVAHGNAMLKQIVDQANEVEALRAEVARGVSLVVELLGLVRLLNNGLSEAAFPVIEKARQWGLQKCAALGEDGK